VTGSRGHGLPKTVLSPLITVPWTGFNGSRLISEP